MTQPTNFLKQELRLVTIGITLVTMILSTGWGETAEIKFPVEVGVKPESITKGFNGNYYVTVMNGSEVGDGELVEISQTVLKLWVSMNPKGLFF